MDQKTEKYNNPKGSYINIGWLINGDEIPTGPIDVYQDYLISVAFYDRIKNLQKPGCISILALCYVLSYLNAT